MSKGQPLPPDFLRRFTPIPYVFELRINEECVRIEADDLEVALAIRDVCRAQSVKEGGLVRFWRLIRDRGAPGYGAECEMFTAGGLTTLMHRTGTILIADNIRRELFGFVGEGLTIQELTDDLLPRLLNISYTNPADSAFYKQVTNSTLRSDNP